MQVNPQEARVKLTLNEQEQAKLSSRGYAIQSDSKLGGFGNDVFHATLNDRPIVVKQLSVWPRAHLLSCAGKVHDDMNRIRHPHILAFYDLFLMERSELIFMELCEGGDLQHHLDGLNEPKWLSELQAIRYFLQFGDALRYLHKLEIAHRAVQTDNIYMGRWKQVCKLGYFGITNQQPEDYHEVALQYPHSDLASDVWRAGITLYVMLNGGAHHQPFGQSRGKETFLANSQTSLQFPNATLSQSARRVIASLLTLDPDMRPTMDKILTEPWFNEGCFQKRMIKKREKK